MTFRIEGDTEELGLTLELCLLEAPGRTLGAQGMHEEACGKVPGRC